MTTASGAFLKNADAVKVFREEIANASGTVAKFRDNQLDTLAGKMTLLGGSIDTLVTKFGKEFDPALADIVQLVIDTTNAIIPLTTAVADTIKFFAKWTKIIIEASTGLTVLRPIIEATMSALGDGAEEAVTPLSKLQEQLTENTKELNALLVQQEKVRLRDPQLDKEIEGRKRLTKQIKRFNIKNR